MLIERQPTLPYRSTLGSQLKIGNVYIRANESNSKEPVVYQVCNYGTQPRAILDLNTGLVFSIDPDAKFVEVKAKVVWEYVL